MAAAAESLTEQIVRKAAATEHVPFNILWGVYGAETGHGSDVKTSSTGAKGSFQFEPATAKAYGYPYTNETSEKVFNEQALAAGKYLAALKAQTGSWEGAIHGYSGGGYTLAHVLEQSRQKGGGKTSPEGTGTGEAGQSREEEHGVEEEGLGVNLGLGGALGFVEALGEPSTWLRVAEGVGGVILFFVGLKTLTRGTAGATVINQPVSAAKGVAKKATEAAAAAVVA
jgi:Transglycosylase SLT domain